MTKSTTTRKRCRYPDPRLLHSPLLRLAGTLLVGASLFGCGSGSKPVDPLLVSPALPTPAPAAASNKYLGTQSPGLWSLTLDDAQQAFSYLGPGAASAVQGNFTPNSGLLDFGQTSAGSAGLALEIPGRATFLRPGDNTTAPVAFVSPSGGCFAVQGRVNFLFVGFAGAQAGTNLNTYNAAYGRVVISTSADGKSWVFGDEAKYELPTIGGGIKPGTLVATGAPLSYTGTCSLNNGQATITADANPILSALPTYVFHPAGYFLEDRPAPTAPLIDPDSNSYAGVVMPAAPLSAADVISHSYAGFVFEPGDTGRGATQPVRLDPVAAASSVTGTAGLIGGAYPDDDLTQTPGIEMTITLGAQDSTYNGVYPQATLVHSDPLNHCVQVNYNQDGQDPNGFSGLVLPGFDTQGLPNCTTRGVAVIGNPEGKYVIYFTALDGTTSDQFNAHPLQMYLYQQ